MDEAMDKGVDGWGDMGKDSPVVFWLSSVAILLWLSFLSCPVLPLLFCLVCGFFTVFCYVGYR
jgi:hypothetical protein